MAVTISQDAEVVSLVWVEGDPISLAFTVADVNWSGTYTAQVRATPASAVLLTLTVTATTNARVATVTVASDIAAANQIVGWLSATAGGAALATSLTSVVAGANTAVLSDAASPTVVLTTHTTGAGILTITVDADVTRYFNAVQRNGTIKSSPAIVLAE